MLIVSVPALRTSADVLWIMPPVIVMMPATVTFAVVALSIVPPVIAMLASVISTDEETLFISLLLFIASLPVPVVLRTNAEVLLTWLVPFIVMTPAPVIVTFVVKSLLI